MADNTTTGASIGSLPPISPGPMRMSDLDPSAGLPPRRLKPISPQQQKKKKRRKKRPSAQPDDSTPSPPLTLLNQDMLSRIRASLEQPEDQTDPEDSSHDSSLVIHNGGAVPSPSETTPSLDESLTSQHEPRHSKIPKSRSSRPSLPKPQSSVPSIPELQPAQPDQQPSLPEPLEVRTPGVGEEDISLVEEKKQRRRSRRKRSKLDASLPPLPQPAPQEVEAVGSTEEVDVEEPLPPAPEVAVEALPIEHASGRQLPEFPMGPEASTEFPRSSIAMHPHARLSIRTDSPTKLISPEDLVERDKEDLAVPRYVLPSAKPNPFISQPKDVIFVERRDGRGFVMKRRDEETAEVEVESTSTDHEVTGIHIALQVHIFLQELSLLAHGVLAGLSLWDALILNTLGRQTGGHLNILEHYSPLTLPSHAVHCVLLMLVLVSLLDRIDFASFDKKCLQDIVRSPAQIVLLAVLLSVILALVLTLSMAAVDERVSLYSQQPTLWLDVLTAVNTTLSPTTPSPLFLPSPITPTTITYVPASTSPTSERLRVFLALVLVRALCCGLSWFAVVWITSYDRMRGYLNSVTEDWEKSESKQQ